MENKEGTSALIQEYVNKRLKKLLDNPAEGEVKAQLARLRRGIGKEPGELPELWAELFEDLPEDLMGKRQEPSEAEWAIYTALTLYALHQQGKDIHSDNVNQQGQRLGTAVARLTEKDPDSKEAIRRRFNAMATSADITELSWHLRGMIQLLRRGDAPISLDYPQLAVDLYWYQSVDRQASVRLGWGRDYYRELNKAARDGKDVENNDQ